MFNFADRLARSRDLFLCTFGVARQHKKLFLFPLLGLACGVLLVVLCAAPTIIQPSEHNWREWARWQELWQTYLNTKSAQGEHSVYPTAHGWIFFGVVYFPLTAIGVFFNVACYQQILRALNGEAVSLRAGVAFAWKRIGAIVAWSLLAGLVGFAIQMVAERLGWLNRFVVSLVGYAWSVAAVFVIPVMIREDSPNPLRLLRISAATVKKTWAETLLGFVGIQFGMIVIVALAVVSSTVLMFASLRGADVSAQVFMADTMIFIGAMILTSLFFNVLNHIYRCALYIYAAEGVVPGPFSEEQMQLAWKVAGRK